MARPALLFVLLSAVGIGGGSPLFATSVIPISDAELYRRADVIVHGVVLSSDTVEDARGRPQTVSVVQPLAILKGRVAGNLILRQAGGRLPDGRFFELPGRPEYVPAREVIVFALALPEGDYQTAEMLLGKFEIWQDQRGTRFALPDLAWGAHPGVVVHRGNSGDDFRGPRLLSRFLEFLSNGGRSSGDVIGRPAGELTPVVHPTGAQNRSPLWGNLGSAGLVRWDNCATDAWVFDGMANMTGGGIAEATNGLATWTNDPTSIIHYTAGGGPGKIHLNVPSNSNCGWSTCISSSGVIACGGPSGDGSTNDWRGETYKTITNGEVWLRAFCTFNEFTTTIVQSVITHELGHTLGLGHSDIDVSPHDVCRGDENAAIMYSVAQDRTTLGTDDQDAIRWIYGDGGNSCTTLPPPGVFSINPVSGPGAGGTPITVTGARFEYGAAVTIGGAASFVSCDVVPSTTIPATTGVALAPGFSDVVVINPDGQAGSLPGAFFYDFIDVPASHPFYSYVLKMLKDVITAGCGGDYYCPDNPVTRAQMAVFLLRAEHGSSYLPPACRGIFADVPCPGGFAVNWIEQLSTENITAGCGGSNYCPDDPVTRAQMAVFLLKAEHGPSYTPPACTAPGIFNDVVCPGGFAVDWIEQLDREGVTGGCNANPPRYCPDSPNTRGQMAVFLTTTFHLP